MRTYNFGNVVKVFKANVAHGQCRLAPHAEQVTHNGKVHAGNETGSALAKESLLGVKEIVQSPSKATGLG